MAFWTVELTVKGILANSSNPMFECKTNFKNLKLNFDVDTHDGQALKVPAESVTAQYSAEMDADIPQFKKKAFSMGKVDNGSAVSNPSFTVSRVTDLDLPPFEADDGGADQPPGSIVIGYDVVLSGMSVQMQAGPLQGSDTTDFGAPGRIRSRYDPRENVLILSGSMENKGVGIEGQYDMTLTFNGALQARSSSTDFTQTSKVVKGHIYSDHPSPYFAFDTTGAIFVHGNVSVQPQVNGEDKSGILTPVRMLRQRTWTLLSDQGSTDARGTPVGAVQWAEDNESDSKSWHDVPGIMTPFPFKSERTVQEFLWGAKNFPEFKPLYYIVVIDTLPGKYRVRVSKPETVSLDIAGEVLASNALRTTEDTATFESDSGWRQGAVEIEVPQDAVPANLEPPAPTIKPAPVR